MPVMEHEGTGSDGHLDSLLRSLRRPMNGASSMAHRPHEIMSARTTSRYGQEATMHPERQSYADTTNYDTRRRRHRRGTGTKLISAVNAMPITRRRLHNVGTQTMSETPTPIPRVFQPLRNQHYQSKVPTGVDSTAWRTRDIFDVPDSDDEHNRPLQASTRTLSRSQPEKVEASTPMAPASNQRKRNLGDNAAKHDLIWISSDDDSVSSSTIDKKRRRRDGRSDHGTQMDVMKPVSTHSVSLKKLETPESKLFSLPKIPSDAPQIETARMKSGFHCETDAQLSRTNTLACRMEKTTGDCHLAARYRSHERNAVPCAETSRPSTQDLTNQAFIDAITQEMRTPSSSIFEGYLPEKNGEPREESRIAGLYEAPKQMLELTAQVRSTHPRRNTSQVIQTHKTMQKGYYEAIRQHVRRWRSTVPQKHILHPGFGRNAVSFDQEELQSTSVQDFQIGGDTELELINASSAVQRIVRRMNKTVRRMTNDEY
ncbi:hypothetical protein MMC27_004616 [Xylographa pallens]|nr:hypothetical protein [Xylographa pallens]